MKTKTSDVTGTHHPTVAFASSPPSSQWRQAKSGKISKCRVVHYSTRRSLQLSSQSFSVVRDESHHPPADLNVHLSQVSKNEGGKATCSPTSVTMLTLLLELYASFFQKSLSVSSCHLFRDRAHKFVEWSEQNVSLGG